MHRQETPVADRAPTCTAPGSGPQSELSRARALGGRYAAILSLAVCVIAACNRGADRAPDTSATSSENEDRRIVVFNAGSLALPLRAALDSFAAREHVTIEQENAGSLETARKVTELGKLPDIVAVADYEVIPLLLIPSHATW